MRVHAGADSESDAREPVLFAPKGPGIGAHWQAVHAAQHAQQPRQLAPPSSSESRARQVPTSGCVALSTQASERPAFGRARDKYYTTTLA